MKLKWAGLVYVARWHTDEFKKVVLNLPTINILAIEDHIVHICAFKY